MHKNIQLKILDPRIGHTHPLPRYTNEGDAGIDLRAMVTEPFDLHPGQAELVPTGIAVFIQDPNVDAELMPRSGLGHKQGLVLGNLTGVIDSQYQDQVYVSLWNRNPNVKFVNDDNLQLVPQYNEDGIVTINPGDRIAQMVFKPIVRAEFVVVQQFSDQDMNRHGGFGSSGVQ